MEQLSDTGILVAHFEATLTIHEKGLLRNVYSIVGDESLANDITQETLKRAFLAILSGEYKRKGRMSVWLHLRAQNLAWSHAEAIKSQNTN
ncbi:MAG: hypothetical protein QG551_222 [Patescibacteria group bacterium]|nr:hypothetical protein [Patescibacteria group bacterium]